MDRFTKGVLGGAIGMVALYALGKTVFKGRRGTDSGGHEREHSEKKTVDAPKDESAVQCSFTEKEIEDLALSEKRSKPRRIFNLYKLLSKKNDGNIITDLFHKPENYIFEACVNGERICINIKPKTVRQNA